MIPKTSKMQESKVVFDWWAVERPKTKHWGSGDGLYKRLTENFGAPDIVFGKTDGIPEGVVSVDINPNSEATYISDWKALPFQDNQFEFGYWDPPYYTLDKNGNATLKRCLYKKEGQEIWRVCKRLAILHTHLYPRAWLKGAEREGLIAISMGPMKQLRVLHLFRKLDSLSSFKAGVSLQPKERSQERDTKSATLGDVGES